MSTGTAVATGDLITAAKMNLKLETVSNSDEATDFAYTTFKASGTLPAGTVAYIGRDNTNDITVNALTTGAFNVAVAGTDEYTFDATAFTVLSGNRIDYDAAQGSYAAFLRDVNNNELLDTYATASAVNGLAIRNSATGAAPIISAQGTGAEANIGIVLHDSNGNELVEFSSVALATNGLLITNATTGNPVRIGANGTGATANRGIRFDDSNGNEELVAVSVATAVNYLQVTNSATLGSVLVDAVGDDTNVGLTISTKGSGTLLLRTSATTSRVRFNDAYTMTWFQATANYTVAWSDPAAARTITFPDPGGNDSVVYLATTQSLSGKTISLSGNLTFASALDIIMPAATAAALDINDGTTNFLRFDSRATTDGVVLITVNSTAPTIAGVGGTTYNKVSLTAFTFTTSTQTTITAMNGIQLNLAAPTIAQSGGAVTVTTASTLMVAAPVAGGSVTITNRYIINTDTAGCFCTAAGVWTGTSSRASKEGITPIDLSLLPGMLDTVEVVSFRKRDASDGGYTRFGVIAEDVPDFLAMPGRKGIGAIYLAGFALVGVKYLKAEQDSLKEEIAKLLEKLQGVETRLTLAGV